jgi:hypothetical protein
MNLFYTEEFKEYAKCSKTWIAYGTFLSAPKENEQLYVIYGKYVESFYPLIIV